MLHDRVLVKPEIDSSERKSGAGLVIPATAVGAKRLAWGTVVSAGEHVRQVKLDDRVLFEPEDRSEVDINGTDYILLRERDIHAVTHTPEVSEGAGLYL